MKFTISLVFALAVAVAWMSMPATALGQQQHEQHHPGASESPKTDAARPDMAKMMVAMKANDQKLDELVKNMNSAQGSARVDAIAELLTKLVQDHRAMHESMMSNMSMMMNMMSEHSSGGTTTPQK